MAFLVLLAFFYIGKLDKLPRTDCCGCSCHTRAKYAGTVAPGPVRQVGIGGGWPGAPSATAPPQGQPGEVVAIPVPHAGWEDGAVLAEIVVRTPGSNVQQPSKTEK
ncbi:hypothetical protein MNEG_15852 [Monoraphidium neglectum]|uniref:Uncharacterized protein n=1 Tax=Monoraphidium neglectum TaxID=145388 RepID=A0A0D2IW17_9CHLO|nr:hypothetical protein MNEG_15852 [Monoraphidium neglectum]KIY92112.1 hypothetical protein MNEG_15852 [Monoraphidium neglectum]|eukprot:XP_013891132.1 hypothetical protein MNEG_15852 [Monoraphidium neglectum]